MEDRPKQSDKSSYEYYDEEEDENSQAQAVSSSDGVDRELAQVANNFVVQSNPLDEETKTKTSSHYTISATGSQFTAA